MKRILACSALVLVGCGSAQTSFVRSDTTTLGRVVVYRNGVAYFERYADLQDDSLRLSVPADKVDDFLKSLTVVDAQTGAPAPVAYPTDTPRTGTGLIDMKIQLPGPRPHRLKLSYVTEAPSWKPSYRIVVDKTGKLDLEAWAIVDNTSGEDWTRVRLGVGASSALSFRFDLRSVRNVQRETLHSNDLFAQAPPSGGSTFDDGKRKEHRRVVGDISDEVIATEESRAAETEFAGNAHAGQGAGRGVAMGPRVGPAATAAPVRPAVRAPAADSAPPPPALGGLAQSLQRSQNQIVVEGYANANDGDKQAASLARANKVREQLLRNGVDPNRVVAVGRGEMSGRAGGVRIVEEPPPPPAKPAEKDGKTPESPPTPPLAVDPIGTSHFESQAAITVPRGTSAMVAILKTRTEGEVVYLYDKESQRGNADYAFRSVRLQNPTDSALEGGPVTVFGDGRFIGEGLSEAIPARSTAFIPFALDRQIVVETKADERDEIARIITVQRGVFSTEVKHTRRTRLVLHNRQKERASVYVRHTVPHGFELTKASAGEKGPNLPRERLGVAHLFRVEVDPGDKREVVIEEATPLFKTTDVRTQVGMDLVRVYLSSAAVQGPLKVKLGELLEVQKEIGNLEQRIQTTREQMSEYRQRMDELHAQLVTLKLVKTAGPLMQSLEKKMQEMSDKLSKATIDVVALQEKLMISRIHFQDGVADLSLEQKDPKEKTVADTK